MKLEVSDLTVRYGEGHNAFTAVDSVSVTIPAGQTLGLVGESGCGKSTLGRAIVNLVPLSGGEVRIDGEDYSAARKRKSAQFHRRVQMVFQDPYSSLNPRMTIEESIRDALRTRGGLSRKSRQDEMLRLVETVGLAADVVHRYPHQFSGGQRQRIAIARALAVGPEVIIHDEVTSALDVSVQATVLNMLKEVQTQFGFGYLFISHDLSTVRYMSDIIAVMYLGRIVEVAPTDALFSAPQHPYTTALMSSIPRIGEARRSSTLVGDLPDPHDPPTGCRFHTRCPVGPMYDPSRQICIEVDPQADANGRAHQAACHFAGTSAKSIDVQKGEGLVEDTAGGRRGG